MADTPDKPRYWLNTLRHELFQQVLPRWLNKSLDKEGGGYFNCIYEDGSLFDTTNTFGYSVPSLDARKDIWRSKI